MGTQEDGMLGDWGWNPLESATSFVFRYRKAVTARDDIFDGQVEIAKPDGGLGGLLLRVDGLPGASQCRGGNGRTLKP